MNIIIKSIIYREVIPDRCQAKDTDPVQTFILEQAMVVVARRRADDEIYVPGQLYFRIEYTTYFFNSATPLLRIW